MWWAEARIAVDEPATLLRHRIVREYTVGNQHWSAVVISPYPPAEQLGQLGGYLHRMKPGQSFWIFDEADGVDQFILWQQSPTVFPYPEDWLKQHSIASVAQLLGPGGLRWQMTGEAALDWARYQKIADLE